MEKENPDLYKKIYEPKVDTLVAEVTEKLNLSPAAAVEGTEAQSPSESPADEEGEKKHQSRGGKGLIRDESAKLDKEAQKRAVSGNMFLFYF